MYSVAALPKGKTMSFVMSVWGWYDVDKGNIYGKMGCEFFGK